MNYNNAHFQQLEEEKQRVCNMLIDMNNQDYKRVAINCTIDAIRTILNMPIQAQDRIFFQQQMQNLTQPQNSEQNNSFKSAEEIVSKNGHRKK
jgi:hypothetical protein